MSILNAASKRFLDTAFGDASHAWVVRGHYDAQDELAIIQEGPAGSFTLPDGDDLYYCVATVDGSRKKAKRVWVLVIDDVGKEINRELFDMTFPLRPSKIVESSSGSYHYIYFIDGGMPEKEFKALRLAMRASPIWGDAHNTSAVAIYRLPQGTHTKSTHGGWKVREELWAGIKYTPEQMWAALAPAGAPRAPARGSSGDFVEDEALLRALVEIVPNVTNWFYFVDVGRAIWGASDGGAFDVFDEWAQKCPSYNPELTQGRWDSYHDAHIGRFWLLRHAMKADKAAAETWLRAESKVEFDDGEDVEMEAAVGLPKALQLKYAREIAARWGHEMRYVLERKAWAEFDGNIWRHMPSSVKLGHLRAMEMALTAPPKDKGEHDVTTLSFLDGVEGICRQIPALQARQDDFDRDLMLLGTPVGTVDLVTGVHRAADPLDMISKCCAVAPAEGEDCPRWLKFIDEVTMGDGESAAFLQQYGGYCLTGVTKEEVFLFLHGPGKNGKSKFADTLMGVMGGYAVKPVGDLFVKKAHGMGHTSKLAMLAGARLSTISEVPANAQWDEVLLKDVTGGGSVTAGFKHKDEFTFEPAFKLLAYGNHQPTFPGGIDESVRRRFWMMEFRFMPKLADPDLFGKLKKEWPGILRWMINGCLEWQKMGLMKPTKVQRATDAFFKEQDLIGQWLEACVVDKRGSVVSATDLFNNWREWRNKQGDNEQLNNPTVFGREMINRGYVKKDGAKCVEYQNIAVKSGSFDDLGQEKSE